MCFPLEFATVIYFYTATCFYAHYFAQVNVGWKFIEVVLNLDNSVGVAVKEGKMIASISWWMEQIHEADLDLFEVNPWLWVTSNNFL